MKIQLKNIGQVAEVIAGQSPSSDSYNEKGEGLPFYQGKTDFGEINPIPRKWCTNPKKIAESNDILMAVRAPVGPVNLANEEACIGRGLAAIRSKGENDFRYIYFFLKNNQDLVSQYSTGSTFKSISKRDIEQIKINIPKDPIDQKRIAQVLTDCETLISKRKESITLLDELLKSTFLKMFGDPVKNEKEWTKFVLKKLTKKIGSGSTPRGGKEAYKKTGVSLIRSMNIYDNYFRYKNLAFIDNIQAKKLDGVTINKEDVLINITGASVARVTVVPYDLLPARINQHVAILRVRKELLNPYYLSYLLSSQNYKKYLIKTATLGGATREAITKVQLEKLKIPKADIDLQNKFGIIVEKVEETKKLYQDHLTELENLYGRLSQDAFKGELDLSKMVLREEFLIDDELEIFIKRPKTKKEKEKNSGHSELGHSGRRINIGPKDPVYYPEIGEDGFFKRPEDYELESQLETKNKEKYSQPPITEEEAEDIKWEKVDLDKPLKLRIEDVSSEFLAEGIKKRFRKHHFSMEMLISYFEEEQEMEISYYSSEELKKKSYLHERQDLRKFIFSTIIKDSISSQNPYLKLEQVFYNGQVENFDLRLSARDYKIFKEKDANQRSGIYFKIVK